ncbi:hypothetical protein BAMTA208_15190 [Bacillus amyloliquefaciens TA208]|nr:hypothetical protein BAMTA208_15190 [Bacillus amyloliquefaciens TA208]
MNILGLFFGKGFFSFENRSSKITSSIFPLFK